MLQNVENIKTTLDFQFVPAQQNTKVTVKKVMKNRKLFMKYKTKIQCTLEFFVACKNDFNTKSLLATKSSEPRKLFERLEVPDVSPSVDGTTLCYTQDVSLFKKGSRVEFNGIVCVKDSSKDVIGIFVSEPFHIITRSPKKERDPLKYFRI